MEAGAPQTWVDVSKHSGVTPYERVFGRGLMARRTLEHNWTRTSLGAMETWPASLRLAVGLVLNSAVPTYLAWGPELLGFHNDAYLNLVGGPDALGAPFAETWPGTWKTIQPLVEAALAGEKRLARNVPVTWRRRGVLESKCWTIGFGPVFDEHGVIRGVQSSFLEVSSDVARAALAEREEIRGLFERAPSAMAFSRGPEHIVQLANATFRRVIGQEAIVGRPIRQALPELEGQGYLKILDQVLRTGEPFTAQAAPFVLAGADGRALEPRLVDLVFEPILDAEGRATGIFFDGIDVTERERSAERQALLIHELNHRVKNTLVTVQAIVAQSVAGTTSAAELRERVEQRLMSLASAHDTLTREHWSGANARDIVCGALASFAPEGDRRRRLAGANVRLNPRQAVNLAMALHELATNATKYGAWSSPLGRVLVSWNVEAAPEMFVLDWVESGGPIVNQPTKKGFGSRLLERGVARELGGKVRLEYAATGVTCQIAFPLGA